VHPNSVKKACFLTAYILILSVGSAVATLCHCEKRQRRSNPEEMAYFTGLLLFARNDNAKNAVIAQKNKLLSKQGGAMELTCT